MSLTGLSGDSAELSKYAKNRQHAQTFEVSEADFHCSAIKTFFKKIIILNSVTFLSSDSSFKAQVRSTAMARGRVERYLG